MAEPEADALFDVPELAPPVELVPDMPAGMTAADVKAALRRRHPGDDDGAMVGQWTCIEEWRAIDMLALNAWSKADVVGYEVKVSRSDMRGELLRPDKRSASVAMTTEFYFAVPAGLLTPAEIAWEEPEWRPGDFRRKPCPGVPEFGGLPSAHARHQRWGGYCAREPKRGRGLRRRFLVRVPPPPEVTPVPKWVVAREGEDEAARIERYAHDHYRDHLAWNEAPCWMCGGKGYLELSLVERTAPALWVPADVGLITVSARGCCVVKASPKRVRPEPIAATRKHLNDLVRWVSHRPDPRHR